MKLKTLLAVCSLVLCLAVSAASLDDPYKIYDEMRHGAASGNAYYFGGVFDGTAYVGHIYHGAQQWGIEQKLGTGCLNATDNLLPLNPNNVAKSAVPLGGWIYMSNGAGNLCRVKNWNDAVMPEELPSPVLINGVPVYCDCITTDGTYIYVSTGTGAATHPFNTVYKYAVDHEAATLTLVWQSAPEGSSTATHRFRALSYWNGKLYTSNNIGATAGYIYEIDCETGAFTHIATMNPAASGEPYQVARYGNEIYAVSTNGRLYKFNYVDGSWVQDGEPVDLGVGALYGIAVTGTNGVTAKYAWISHIPGSVSLWDLDPQWTTKSLGEARDGLNGHPAIVNNVVVTKHGNGGFWVEAKDRSAAAFVNSGSAPPVGHLCTLKGGLTENALGESVFNTLEVTDNGPAPEPIEPLYLNNKAMNSSIGGAGLPTDGMLVKVTGRCNLVEVVGEENPVIFVYFDDGSGLPTDKPDIKGVKITTPNMFIDNLMAAFYNPTGYEVTVTGIVRFEKASDGTIVRMIEALSDDYIVITPIQ